MQVSTKTVARGSSEMLAQSAEQACNESQDAPTDEHDTSTPFELSQTPKIEPTQAKIALLLRQMLSLPRLQLQPLLKQNRLKKPSSKPKLGLHESEEQGVVGNLRTSTTG